MPLLRHSLSFLIIICGSLACATAWPADGDAQRSAPSDASGEFIAAWQRVRSNQPDLPDSDVLQHYLIYDYLQAARLRRELQQMPSEALDTRIEAFLKVHNAQPVSRPLRRDWLVSLGTRARWDLFLPRAADSTDAQILCLRFAGRLATGDTAGLAAEALLRWRQPQSLPPECGPVLGWLRQQGGITPAVAEERTRAALAADNWRVARESVDEVPAPRNAPLLQWIELLRAPRPELEALARDPGRAVESRALLAGFARFAIADAAGAATLLPQLLKRQELTPEDKGQLQRGLALGAAYSRIPDALRFFERVPAEQIDVNAQEWRVRAALLAGNFRKAQIWLEQMPPQLASQTRWRYWHARAVERNEGFAAAVSAYTELAGLRDFFGYLAADRVHRPYQLNAVALAGDAALQASLAAREGLRRAHALVDCGLPDEAGVEWAVALGDADAATRTQAALLAAGWGWYAQAIVTLAQLGAWDDVKLRYPRPYAQEVARASERTGVPADWIYAVMRQESLYRSNAVSSAGARGLLQVMPGTAAALAKRWKVPYASRDALFDPATATLLGAAHLREVLDKYQGALPLSLAAYNAGAVPVARWRPRRTLDADVWIENIPYVETRGYVQRVLEHIVAFAWVREARLPRLSELMPPVQPLQ